MNRLIGLMGAKGAGKDTLAELLVNGWGFMGASFAGALYEEVAAAYGVSVDLLKSRLTKEEGFSQLQLAKCRNRRFVQTVLPMASLSRFDRIPVLDFVSEIAHGLGWCIPSVALYKPWVIQDSAGCPENGCGHWENTGTWRAASVAPWMLKRARRRASWRHLPGPMIDALQALSDRFGRLAAVEPGSTVDAETMRVLGGPSHFATRMVIQLPNACVGDCDEKWEAEFAGAAGALALWIRQLWSHAQLVTPRSPRWTLQLWGTEYRCKGPDGRPSYWVDKVAEQLERNPAGRFVLRDVRRLREAKLVQDAGGVLVRIRRPELERLEAKARADGVPTSLHDTETELLHYPAYLEVLNHEGHPEWMLEAMRTLLTEPAQAA